MKICVYTCITNGYELPKEIKPQGDIDFICFTDNMNIPCNGWTLREIPEDFRSFGKNKIQRLVKILAHRVVQDYDISIWVDGNIQVLCDIRNFINSIDIHKHFFMTRRHPTRNCIYMEERAVLRMRKDIPAITSKQMSKYRRAGYPKNFGLIESNIIVRRHNDGMCRTLDEMWSDEVIFGSHRDQLSFNYCLWKTGLKIGYLNVNNLITDERFRWIRHGK